VTGAAGRGPGAGRVAAVRPLVSVVVPTRDAGRTIRSCLQSVREQDYAPVELIVVDNDSSDSTFAVAAELADLALRGGPERSAQRNRGIAEASGEWLLWVDADMVLGPDVVRVAVATAQIAGADAVFIPEESFGDGFWTACRALERRCYHREPLIEAPRLVRRELLTGAGGFLPDVAGQEDADLRMRLLRAGTTLAWAAATIRHDEGRLTLGGILSKRAYYGRSIPAYAAAQPGAVPAQARATVRALLRHRRLLLADPPHAVGMLVMRACEAAAYAVGAARAGGRPGLLVQRREGSSGGDRRPR